MSTFLTLTDITYECARVLVNNLVAAKYVNRSYDNRFAKSGAKIGDITNLRLPVRNTVSDGSQLVIQDDTETSTPLRLDKRKHIGFAYTKEDQLLKMDDFSKRFIAPKVASLANQVDADILALAKKVWNSVGTPGTTPNASSTYLSAGVKLDNNSAPQDEERYMIVPSQNHATLVAAEQTLFNSREEVSKQYRKGRISGGVHGFNWYMDQNAYTHTVGTYAGTPLVNGASQSGTSLITDGWTSTSLVEGDVFTIDGVYGVNPQSYQSTGSLQQFRVTADITDTAGAITVSIEPEIILSGPFQTVTALPANNAAITMVGATGVASPQGIGFHRDAFALVMVDLPEPGGGATYKRISDEQSGISMLITEQFDIVNFRTIVRLDILYGVAAYRPQLACRIWS